MQEQTPKRKKRKTPKPTGNNPYPAPPQGHNLPGFNFPGAV